MTDIPGDVTTCLDLNLKRDIPGASKLMRLKVFARPVA